MTTHSTNKSKITPKQEAFCREYLVDLNATQAAIRAGYSAKTADRIGAQLLGKTWVAERVQALKQERSKATQITAEYVLNTIFETVESAKVDGDKQIVLKGAELLGKHLGIFVDRQRLENPDGSAITPNITLVVQKGGNDV